MTIANVLICAMILVAFITMAVIAGMYLSLRLMLKVLMNDDNYARWVVASEKFRRLLRLKGHIIEDEVGRPANGGY